MATNDIKPVRQRNFLARDFNGFRSVLLDYARQHYPDRIQDFSESSMGGLFLDMAAYVGDTTSFYLDHLFNELHSDTAVETSSIERILRNANVVVKGAAASVVSLDFYQEIPVLTDGSLRVDTTLLNTIKADSAFRSDNGTDFVLLEDVDFWENDEDTGEIVVKNDVEVTNGRRINGTIVSKILKKSGLCTSGQQTSETFTFGTFTPFKKITLAQPDVSQIISVSDSLGNVYYQVDSLTHDVVYKNVLNQSIDKGTVKDALRVIPAPYRFISNVSLRDRKTTLTFGGGTASSLEDDVIPDPSEFSLSLPGTQTFSRTALDPSRLMRTSTLGVAAENTVVTVTYRYGGGLSHNVNSNSIKSITSLEMSFPASPVPSKQTQIRNTVEVLNSTPASGGEDALTPEELLALVPAMKNAQERMVTREDLLARIYTMPNNFGRVFRASIRKNPNNPLASSLYVISRSSDNKLIPCPDALKINLKNYLRPYRMINDAFDIFDAGIVNLKLTFQVIVDPSLNKSLLLQSLVNDLKKQFDTSKMSIDQPIVLSDIASKIHSKQGVIGVDKIKFDCATGTVGDLTYSLLSYDIESGTRNQILYPPAGCIFEIRYPDVDIIGKCVSNL